VIPILGVVAAVVVLIRSKPVEERKRIAPRTLPSRTKPPVKPQPPRFIGTFVDVIEGDMRNVVKRFRKREIPVVAEVPKEQNDDSGYWME
jgi:hypothetical protein